MLLGFLVEVPVEVFPPLGHVGRHASSFLSETRGHLESERVSSLRLEIDSG